MGMWRAVRPGLVAKDPMFMGDEMALCDAYGSGNYALASYSKTNSR